MRVPTPESRATIDQLRAAILSVTQVYPPGGLMGDMDCRFCGRPTVRGRHFGRHSPTCFVAELTTKRDRDGCVDHEDIVDLVATDEQLKEWGFASEVERFDATLRNPQPPRPR